MGGTHSALALGGVYLIGVRTLVRIPLINIVDTVNFAGGSAVLICGFDFVFISLPKEYQRFRECQLSRCLISLVNDKAVKRFRYIGLGF